MQKIFLMPPEVSENQGLRTANLNFVHANLHMYEIIILQNILTTFYWL